MVKSLKYFKFYVLHSRVIAYVPSSTIQEVLNHLDIDGKRGKWIEKIQEYDLEIKTTKLIKGQGVAKLLAKSNSRALGINHIAKIS